ncbi:MAG: hypothetical protein LBN30_04530 [Oscillospiraceae bacterium]|nr:hypothetical protein [Oscillospiraceae bacterium]
MKKLIPVALVVAMVFALATSALAAPEPPLASLSVSGGHVAAITADGALYTWGNNSYGQLGIGNRTSKLSPTKVADGYVSVAAGSTHTLAIAVDGSLYAWGDNSYGQVGDGYRLARLQPVKVMTDVAAVAAGGSHSLALKTDGTLYAWGQNAYGQVGDGSRIARLLPIKIASDVAFIAAGDNHSVYITTDGTLYAWGANARGQVGDGSRVDRLKPVKIKGGMKSAAPGGAHTLAITEDGTLYAWGSNAFGQLGDKSRVDRLLPVKVMENVASVAAGSSALDMTGLGSATGDGALVSIIISLMGGAHSTALKTDGTVWAWGSNNYGQLGDASRTDRLTPVKIMDDAIAIAGGGDACAALKADGSLYTWGFNSHGQVGDGTRLDKLAPTRVLTGVRTDDSATNAPEAEKPANTPLLSAAPNPSRVLLDGKEVKFDAYTVADYNYFKLRDLAFALNNSLKRFSVDYYSTENIIALTAGGRYTAIGGELAAGGGTAQATSPSTDTLYLNGTPIAPKGYNIANANYYKLRDIMKLLNVSVTWDAANDTIIIDTSKPYSE